MSDARSILPNRERKDFLSGGGELGRLIRAHDWRSTPLGDPESWPQNLKLALRIILNSRQPMWIGWGASLVYFYNDAYQSIIGGKHPWALGRPTAEVWHEIWSDIGEMLALAMSGGEATYVEAQHLIMERNGYPEETYYTFSYSPIPNDDGSIGGIICANTDDTQRVIGERQLALLRDLAAGTANARNWQEASEYSIRALGREARDLPFAMLYLAEPGDTAVKLVGASGIDAAHEAAPSSISFDAAGLWPVHEALRSHCPVVVSDLRARVTSQLPMGPWDEPPKQGVVVPIVLSGDAGRAGALVVGLNPFRLFDENYRSFLGLVAGQISAAVTHAQAYEEERRRAEALAEIDRTKTAFFSNVSHEFRTPLTLMLGPLEDALGDATEAALAPSQRERLATAHRNGLRLLKLVNSLLDFSRIEAGRVVATFEPTDLAKLTAEFASNFESATERAQLALSIECEPLPQPVYVDRDMWEKVILNLLSNAFKFTFEGEIGVATRLSDDGTAAEVIVRDTGVGIPPRELPRLFERFHRVEGQRSRSFEGSGIGLALVHELVKLHGGTIGVDSKVGRGTTFKLRLPLGYAHLPPERVGSTRASSPRSGRADAYVEEALRWLPHGDVGEIDSDDVPVDRADEMPEWSFGRGTMGARVLVADDNADMRDYIGRLLRSRWDVETVRDGCAALEAIRRREPDLILTDVMMPGLDGFGLLREIRGDAQLQHLPVVMLSARAGEEARVEGLESGADDYLTKPFSARELMARVNANLEMARLRRDATRELLESEARFRNMANHAPVMMWVSDPTGSLTYLNRLWCEFTGQSLDEALGAGAWNALHADDRKQYEDSFLSANTTGEAFSAECRVRRADGVYRWALSAAAPRFSDDGAFLGYIGSIIDITHRKEAERILRETNVVLERRVASAIAERLHTEAQLRQAQKMEAIGKMTGGVAHDFNNVLQVIAGNLQLLSRDVAGNLRAEQRLQTAIAATSRGSRLASQLLAFGRRQPLSPKSVNLGRLIRGIDDMLRRSLGEGVEIETLVTGGLWNTFVDTVQVENALLNLAINARDAMQGQGKLTIEAGNAFLDETYVARHGDVMAGQYVMVAVTDTGCGIPPELLERVFEPFYTTKPEGQGTGLGLSMVYGFVKQSGGHIKIYSEVGHGTTVRIYLPRARQPEDIETDIETGPITGGSETVLVVEDDEDVRGTVVDLLSELGYRVLRAKDAQSALAIVESGVPIDLLFTDVVMPGPLGSPELARKARERLPNVAVLFTSGYTDNAIVHGGRLDDGVDLLSKPYSREAMARKIRHVLRNQVRGVSVPAPAPSLPPQLLEREVLPDASQLTARVLLVDDDAMVRFTTADMLAYLGHVVTEAGDATDALRLLSERAFDVIVTDIALPDLSGDELAMRAIALQPGLRVIFATGYDALPDDSDHQALAGAMLLRKPYNKERIEEAMNAAMAARLAAGASRAAIEERSAPAVAEKSAKQIPSI
ncbi:response regulator [Trinickia acidisoli]|uniref:response regulator n=1 Tax=Trinickia acidisoli TaxID=2767482 RepID=UPI001A90A4F3|nr:response regulator [Trinickia acidisoli]